MNNVAKHTIKILNFNLTLTSDDDKTYIDSVAQRVERNIRTLSDNMPTRSMTEVALFVAMDYCDRYMKAISDGTEMRGQIKDYLRDSAFLRTQLEESQKEAELLKAENEKLRERLAAKGGSGTAAADVKPAPKAPIDDDDELPLLISLNEGDDALDSVSIPSRILSTSEQDVNKTETAPEKEPEQPKPAKAAKTTEKESFFSRKKSGKGKKKENKNTQPVKGVFSEDEFSESADAADDIMSFFEEKAFEEDDD